MSESRLEVRMLRLDEIRPNPFQPRESFPKEEIQQLANTIKKVGLLQPISVRRKGRTYQIISGERRWRAAQFAELKEIPAIVKDVGDSELMVQSLIENVHRKDLEPIEKARGLAEVYRLVGFEPTKVTEILNNRLKWIPERWKMSELADEERRIKEVADMVGLSYDYQYRLLTLLRFTPEEQRRVSELKIGYEAASSIATIEKPEIRRKVIELAPELKREEVKKVTKIVKKAPEPVVEAVLKREVSPEIAEEIAKIEKPEIMKEALEIAKKGVYTKEGFQTRLLQLTRPRVELPTEPIETQIFNKTLWNLERIGNFDIYTVGYEKKTMEQFINLLKVKKIGTVVDVRKNPVSQYKPEFSKENLEKTLNKNGVKYEHYPELGVPSEIRRKLGETGDYDWFFKWYDKNVLPNIKGCITDFEVMGYPIAFLCVEFDPTKCHRHRIALWFEEKGFRSYDL